MTANNEQLKIDVAVVKQQQKDLDRRHETFMKSINKTMDNLGHGMDKVREEVRSIHGHLTRCRDELREEIDRDFLSQTEAEKIRGSIKQINTKLYMTGAGIVLALSFVQIVIALWA